MHHSHRLLQAAAAVAAAMIMLTGPARAQNVFALNCAALWYQRNSIFKAAGYCFHTPRAIRVFGNAGCAYDNEADVPLSDRARQAINAIQQAERVKGCPR